jgi:hypothetical protein
MGHTIRRDMSWFHLFLFLHITAAIVAFGPTFAFPLIAGLGRKNPMHMPFALKVIGTLEGRLVIPFVLTMPVSGLLMAWNVGIEWNHNLWLVVALIVYAAAVVFAIGVQAPLVHRMIAMTSGGPAAAGAAAMAPMPAGPGAVAAGPPPAFMALAKRMQMGGMLLSLAFLVLMVLMIWKPGGNI